MAVSLDEIRQVAQTAECLYSQQQVEAALDRMAEAITNDLSQSDPLLLSVMLGGLLPAAKLIERLDFPFQYDYLHATRYRNQTRGGELFWLTRPTMDLRGRSVIVVDDILDEGITLNAIVEYCRREGVEQVRSAALVRKLHDRRDPSITVDYLGLDVPDRYVFGYGMDYKGYLRNVTGIYALREE